MNTWFRSAKTASGQAGYATPSLSCSIAIVIRSAVEQEALQDADIVNLLAYAQGNCFIEEDELRRIMDGIEEVMLEAEQENHFQRLRWLPSRHGIRFGTLIKETVRQIVSVRC